MILAKPFRSCLLQGPLEHFFSNLNVCVNSQGIFANAGPDMVSRSEMGQELPLGTSSQVILVLLSDSSM